jgi:hypothetical protein
MYYFAFCGGVLLYIMLISCSIYENKPRVLLHELIRTR